MVISTWLEGERFAVPFTSQRIGGLLIRRAVLYEVARPSQPHPHPALTLFFPWPLRQRYRLSSSLSFFTRGPTAVDCQLLLRQVSTFLWRV